MKTVRGVRTEVHFLDNYPAVFGLHIRVPESILNTYIQATRYNEFSLYSVAWHANKMIYKTHLAQFGYCLIMEEHDAALVASLYRVCAKSSKVYKA